MSGGEVLDFIKSYWFLIIAVIGIFHFYYKKEMKKFEVWQEKYFDEVLSPFRLKYLENSGFVIKDFIDEIMIYEKPHIPNYILHVARQGDYEKLKKIFVADYETMNPSQRNLFSNAHVKVLEVILFFCAFILILGTSPLVLISLMFFILSFGDVVVYILGLVHGGVVLANAMNFSNIISFIIFGGSSVFLMWALITIINSYSDYYSLKNKKIDKIIVRKEKAFEKIQKKIVYDFSNNTSDNTVEKNTHEKTNPV